MCKQEDFEKLSARYGCEFAALMKCSRYNGPVIFFDLRLSHLEALKIPNPEEKILPLIKMLDFFIRAYEQMNSFILCDDVSLCRFYSTNQICKLLSAKNPKPEFMWHNVFPMVEYHSFVPSEVHKNFPLAEWYACHGNAFSCMYFKEIPKSYFKYGKEIVGVENYLPEIMYFLMENIKNGYYPHVIYPCLYKTERAVPEFHPKVVYWHRDIQPMDWIEEKIPEKMLYPHATH